MANGLIGTAPSTGSSALYTELRDAWWNLNSTLYAGAGNGESMPEPNLYMPYAYDCVLTYATAFANILVRLPACVV